MARSTTEDKDLLAVREEEQTELEKSDTEIDNLITEHDALIKDQANKIGVQDENGNWNEGSWADTQTDLANQRTDFTIDTINQQKDQARKDYEKEQSGAYVDWQKQSNQYGVNAEKMASAGMANSGYSESSQVSMYNAYQSRLTAARESYNRAVLNYDNLIKEAKLQNSSILAEIAIEALQKQLELSLQGFQYKNTLILEKANARRQIKSLYQSKYTDILNQINIENAREEEKRQFDILHPNVEIENSEQIEKPETNNTSYTPKEISNGVQNMNKGINPNASNKQAIGEELSAMRGFTYDKAKAFVEEHGLSNGGVPLLSSYAWNQAKRTGQLKNGMEKFSTYSEYLRAWLFWCVEQS
jgi:hypothetical protein